MENFLQYEQQPTLSLSLSLPFRLTSSALSRKLPGSISMRPTGGGGWRGEWAGMAVVQKWGAGEDGNH